MDLGALPPEINSARMYAGPGSGPMLAAAAAWDGLAGDLQSAANSYQSVISGLTTGQWLGPSSASMASAVAPYVAWTAGAGMQADEAASQARLAAGAYEAAFAMTVPPQVVTQNRVQLASLIATNFLGQNSPAIAATEAEYIEMWAQDAAAMYQYAATSAQATTLNVFTDAPQVTDTAGVAAQASTASSGTPTSSLAGLMSSLSASLQGLAMPTASSTGLSGVLSELTGSTSSLSLSSLTSGISSSDWITLAPSWLMTSMTPLYGLSSVLGMAQTLQGLSTAAAADVGAAAADAAGAATDVGAVGSGALGSMGSMGDAAALGSLSIPPSWASVIPTAQLTSAGPLLQNGGMGDLSHAAPPSLLGGPMPRGANGAASAPGPRYGQVPTIMAQPPSAGYGVTV
jgi:PPE-repeat protein